MATAPFTVSGGKFIGPDGVEAILRGVNVYNIGNAVTNAACEPLALLFPNIGIIRLATGKHSYPSVASLKTQVDRCIALGIVVAIEDHLFPQSEPTNGTTQAAQSAWYAEWARAYINEPMLWFMTTNEPTGTFSQVEDNHLAIYKAVRDTGSNAIILMDPYAGGGPNRQGPAVFNASRYANLRNVGWDLHVYSWYFGQSTMDPAKINAAVAQYIGECKAIRSADGPMPVFLGEYGDSTDGNNVDANWKLVLDAVHKSGCGSAAWNYDRLANADNLLNQDGSLSAYGQIVSAHCAAGKRAGRGAVQPPIPQRPESAQGTVITKASDPAIINTTNKGWTLTTGGQIAVDGVTDTSTANAKAIIYDQHRVVHQNMAGDAYSKGIAADAWKQDAARPPIVPPVVVPPPTGITHLTVQAKIDALKVLVTTNATAVAAAWASIRDDINTLKP